MKEIHKEIETQRERERLIDEITEEVGNARN